MYLYSRAFSHLISARFIKFKDTEKLLKYVVIINILIPVLFHQCDQSKVAQLSAISWFVFLFILSVYLSTGLCQNIWSVFHQTCRTVWNGTQMNPLNFGATRTAIAPIRGTTFFRLELAITQCPLIGSIPNFAKTLFKVISIT